MKKFMQIGVACFLLAISPFAGGVTSALSWDNFFRGDSSAPVQANEIDNEHPCLKFTNHEYEVCSAYLANASLAVLVPYYKYANAGDGWTRYVTYRLGSRYTGNAYNQISSRVANWPAGKNEVSIPRIEILSVTSSLTTNTATLTTRENWRVESNDGVVVYDESDSLHTVTMERVPSYLLHKWVVTDVQ